MKKAKKELLGDYLNKKDQFYLQIIMKKEMNHLLLTRQFKIKEK